MKLLKEADDFHSWMADTMWPESWNRTLRLWLSVTLWWGLVVANIIAIILLYLD